MSNGPVQASAFDVGEWQRLTQKRDALMGEVPPKHRALVAQLSGELESVQNQLDEQSNAVAKEMTTQQENHRQVVQGLQAELALERSKGELAAKLEPKTNAAQAEALKIAQEKIIEVVNALRRKSSAPRIDTWEPRQLQLTPKDPNFPASPIGLQSPPEASASSQEVDDIRADISPRPTSQPSAVPKEATATTNAQPRPADSDVVPALPTPVLEKLESPTMGEAPAPPLAEPPVAQEALPVVEAPVVEVPVDPVAEAPVAAAAGPPAAPETVAVAGTKGAEAPETVVAGTKGAEAPESPLVTLLCALMFNKLTIPDAFPILDRKKTGALEYGDVEEVAQTFALADTSRLFKALDVDGDGKVSLDDWTAALSSVDPEIGRAALRARGVSDAS